MAGKLFTTKRIALGLVSAGALLATAGGFHSCGYEGGRNSVVDSDAMVRAKGDEVKASARRDDRDLNGNVIGSTEYSVVAGYGAQTQVLDIERHGDASAVYTDSTSFGYERVPVMDGKVDQIKYPGLGVTLIRENDYEANKRVFDRADLELRAARARFSHME